MAVRSVARLIFSALVLSVTLGFSAIASHAERVEDLTKPTDYVSDFAHVLSPQTVAQLGALCGQLDHSKTNAQVSIVTIKTLDGDDVADFANRLEEKWKVGKKGTDRGILMLFAIQDHKRWIEVGYGLEGILPDAKVGDIGRSMVPQLRAGDYNAAVTGGLVKIANVIATDAGVSLQDSQGEDGAARQPVRRERHRGVSGIGIIFRIIIIVLVLLFLGARGLFGFGLGMLFGGGGRGGWGGGGGFGGGGGGGGDGFGGFGGGQSGGGGAGGDW